METPADWLKTRRRLALLFSDFALSRNESIKVWTGYRVASENIRMSLTEVGIPTTVRQCLAHGEPLNYYTHFVNPVDKLMSSPSESEVATRDLYRRKIRQNATETVITWWRRVQRLGTTAFGKLCIWNATQQEEAFSCFIDCSRYPALVARTASKKRLFSPDCEVRLDHLDDLLRSVGESRPVEELTHHLSLNPADPAASATPNRRRHGQSRSTDRPQPPPRYLLSIPPPVEASLADPNGGLPPALGGRKPPNLRPKLSG